MSLPAAPASPDPLRRALETGVVVLVAGMALGGVIEVFRHPERAAALGVWFAIEAAAGATIVVAGRLLPRVPARVLGGFLFAFCSAATNAYLAYVGGFADRLALAQVVLLAGVVVLFPAGPVGQAAIAAVAVGGFLLAAPYVVLMDGLVGPLLPLVVGAVISVAGAAVVAHHGRRTREEAAANRTLLRASETLIAYLDRADVLERVGALAVEALGCDWSCTLVRDPESGTFRLVASAGIPQDERTGLEALEFTPADLPLLAALEQGAVVEVRDAASDPLVREALAARHGISALVCAPIVRRGELAGFFAVGDRGRVGGLPHVTRRVAAGMANAIAVALDNARLISDLRAATAVKSEFVATMSHELRTPLNVITGYVDLLRDGAFGALDAAQTEPLGRVHRAALDLLELINATLDLGRLESGREEVVTADADVDGLFSELEREFAASVPAGVHLVLENQIPGRTLRTDGLKLRTILKHLVSNALKFTPGGRVELRAGAAGEQVSFVVTDTGIGIAAEHLPAVFDKFRQLDGSSTRRFGGVGLGLHIVKRLVDVLGGTITVESTPGVGSRFTVRLPGGTAEALGATGT